MESSSGERRMMTEGTATSTAAQSVTTLALGPPPAVKALRPAPEFVVGLCTHLYPLWIQIKWAYPPPQSLRHTAGIPAFRTGEKARDLRRARIPFLSFESATFPSSLKPGRKVTSRGDNSLIGMSFVPSKTPECLPRQSPYRRVSMPILSSASRGTSSSSLDATPFWTIGSRPHPLLRAAVTGVGESTSSGDQNVARQRRDVGRGATQVLPNRDPAWSLRRSPP